MDCLWAGTVKIREHWVEDRLPIAGPWFREPEGQIGNWVPLTFIKLVNKGLGGLLEV